MCLYLCLKTTNLTPMKKIYPQVQVSKQAKNNKSLSFCRRLKIKTIYIPFIFFALLFLGNDGWAQSFAIVGSGTASNGSTTYPAPFGNYYWGAKHQFFVTAAQLSAAGIPAGAQISSLGFNVTAINSAPTHNGYYVKVYTTTLTNPISSGLVSTGLVAESTPVNQTMSTGWIQRNFNSSFTWNGTDNLVIETCFNNGSWTNNGNASTQWTTSGLGTATWSRWHIADNGTVCSSTTASSTSTTTRPNIRFGYTSSSPILSVTPSSLSFGYTASGSNSAAQTYTLSGSNLTPSSGSITVTAPAGFQVSLNGSTWSSIGGSVSPSYSGGTINQTIHVRFSPTGSPQAYSGNVTNAGGGASNQNVAVTGTSLISYCAAGPTSTFDSDLFRVQITGPGTNFDHNVGCTGILGTQNFTGLSGINLQQGATYTMIITMGQCGSGTYTNVAKAWVDWNVDGTLAEPAERLGLVSGATSSAGIAYSFNFTVPVGATLGSKRLRVMQRETTSEADVTPCATYSWGSVHDYTVNVTAAASCTTPGTPWNLSGSATGQTTASISWSAGSPAGSPTVTYFWEVYTSGGFFVTSGSTPSTSTSISGLSANTTYYFRVRAYTSCNATYSSWSSNSSNFTTFPAMPATASCNATSFSTVNASWSSSAGASYYYVRIDQNPTYSGNHAGSAIVNAPTTSHTFTGLNPNTTYYVHVAAVNSSWQFNGSRSSSGCTTPSNPCAGAINISSVPVTNQALVCGSSNNLNSGNSNVCGGATGNYMGGNEAIYTFTPSVSGSYTISYSGQTWSAIWVHSGACPALGGTCVGSAGGSGNSHSLSVALTAGTLYYIWFDTWPSPASPCPGNFSIGQCCTSPTPFLTVAAPIFNTELQISSCTYAGEYNTITNVVSGRTYQFRSSNASDRLTLTDESNNCLVSGTTPITWTATYSGTVRLHVTTGTCGTESVCRSTFVQCTSCLAPNFCGTVDHGGGDWTINSNTTVAGNHINVGTFTVNWGVTATVDAACRYFNVEAEVINVFGNINANGSGYAGGSGGSGGSGTSDENTNRGLRGNNGTGFSTGSYFTYGTGGANGTDGQDWCSGSDNIVGAGGGGSGSGGAYGGFGAYGGSGGNGGWVAATGVNCNAATACHSSSGYTGCGGSYDWSQGYTIGNATDEVLHWGSGGGGAGGGGGGYFSGSSGGAGGAGGGQIKLVSNTNVTISGSVTANGTNGGNGGNGGNGRRETYLLWYDDYWGGGGGGGGAGGGSGGGILIRSNCNTSITGTVTANGGNGGNGGSGGSGSGSYYGPGATGGVGGAGSGGRIKIFTNPCGVNNISGTINANVGSNGSSGQNGSVHYGNTSSVAPLNPGTIAGVQTICSGQTPTTLTNVTSPSGGGCGSYSYQWMQCTSGCGSPPTNYSVISGANAITYSPGALSTNTSFVRRVTSGSCTAYSNVITVTVLATPTANAGSNLTVCQGGTTVGLGGGVGGSATGGTWSTPAGGTFSPNANTLNATWTPPAGYSGTATLTLTTTGMAPCAAATSTKTVTVLATPTANAGSNLTVCQGGTTVGLGGGVGGSATGGTWSTPAGGTFSPNANTLNATWTPPAGYSGTATLTLTTTGMAPCAAATSTKTVTVLATPTANAGSNLTVCQGGTTVGLGGGVGGSATGGTWSTPAGGTFSPNANTLNATWTPPAGYSGTATLTLTTTGMAPCAAATSTKTVTVLATPTANAGSNLTVCQGGTTVGLGGSVGGSATGGTWSTPAGGTFSPNANTLNATWTPPAGYSGTATLTLTTTGMAPCAAATSTKTVTVLATPTANAGSNLTICQGGTTVGLGGSVGGSATGGTWSTPAGGTFSPNANTLNATWTPPAGYSGTATLTLTTTGMAPCAAATSTKTVTVLATPTANAGSNLTICQGGTTVGLGGSVGGSATGGTWSTPAGGTFSPNANTLNATWTPPAGYSGTATLTLTTTGMAPCAAATSTKTVTVNPPSYYRTYDSGNWSVAGNWEHSCDGLVYYPASSSPSSTFAGSVVVRSGHTITQNQNYTSGSNNNIIVETGAILNMTTALGNFNFNTIQVFGRLIRNHASHLYSGAITVQSGGVYEHAVNGGSMPTITWNPGSVFEITGMTTLTLITGSGQNFRNVIFNSSLTAGTGFTLGNETGMSIAENLTVNNTGLGLFTATGVNTNHPVVGGDYIINGGTSAITFGTSVGPRSVTIGGNLIVNTGGILDLSRHATNLATLNISGDLTVHIGGNIITSTNVSVLNISGHWSNQGTINLGECRVNFIGSSPQNINAGGSPFHIFQINNNQHLTLLSNLTINHRLEMTSGNILTGAHALTLGSGIIQPGSLQYVSGFVVGTMTRWFANSTNLGASSGLFPLGVGSPIKNRNMYVAYTTAPSGGTLTARFEESAMEWQPPHLSPTIPQTGACLEFKVSSYSDEGYWEVTEGSPMGGVYTIHLTGEGIVNITDICELTALRRQGVGNWESVGVHMEPQGSFTVPIVRREGVSGWSNWGFGGGDSNPLPVELLGFDAECRTHGVLIRWNTASEQNNDYFIIEKSDDAITFESIGKITGSGTTNILNSYSYIDHNTLTETVYYRLAQVDYDGTATHYGPIAVACHAPESKEQAYLQVYPNPFTNKVTVVLHNVQEESTALVELYDKMGKLLWSEKMQVSKENRMFTLHLSHLSMSVYELRVTGESYKLNARIVKQ
jgi:hypothetical protein